MTILNININDWKFLSYDKLKNFIDLSLLDSSVFGYKDQFPDAVYAYHDGNLTFENNLIIEELFDRLTNEIPEVGDAHLYGICINGDLLIENSLLSNDSEDMSCSLVVKGNLNSKSVIIGGIRIQVLNNLSADIVYYKENSEGALIHSTNFSGKLYVDHWKQMIREKTGTLIEIKQGNCKILTQIIINDILAPLDEFDTDDYYEFSYLLIEDYLLPYLIEGKTIFVN